MKRLCLDKLRLKKACVWAGKTVFEPGKPRMSQENVYEPGRCLKNGFRSIRAEKSMVGQISVEKVISGQISPELVRLCGPQQYI